MGREVFISQLRVLGYSVRELANNFVEMDYVIPVGRFSGQHVVMAFQFDTAFPMNPPSGGPHFKPLLLPVTGGGGAHPYGAVHNSPLGAGWEYWSRPFKDWNKTDRSVRAYMAHIRHLLETIPLT